MSKFDLDVLDEDGGAADAIVDELEADDEYSEAEHRLELARYYKQLTRGGLFDVACEEARIVDQEVRDFAKMRMNVLIGIQEDPTTVAAPMPFTEEQLTVLLQLADRMLERQDAKPTPAEPVIRRVEPPPPRKPVSVAPPRPRQPPPAVAPKPAVSPLGRKKQPKKIEKAEPAKPVEEQPLDYASIPTGEVFVENGKKYKFVDVPNRTDDEGNQKRAKIDVTEQVKSPQAIPTPRREHMLLVSGAHAQDTLDANIGNSDVAMRAAAHSLNSD